MSHDVEGTVQILCDLARKIKVKLEDLKVLRRSPDLLNNVTPSPKAICLLVPEKKTFKGFLPYMGMVAILVM